jgi:Mn-dependent DtxR family transcriptional regulator
MTISELQYLMAVNKLITLGNDVKLVAIAKELNVSKTSVSKGLERLKNNGYIVHGDKGIALAKRGKEVLDEYMSVVEFIQKHLEGNFNIPSNVAYYDALGCACALSEPTRRSFAMLAKADSKKNL